MTFKEQIDIWSGWHFFGSYFLASWASKLDSVFGIFIVLCGGVIWEIIDQIYSDWVTSRENILEKMNVKDKILYYKKRKFWDRIFDFRGFSDVDLGLDFLGCTLCYIWLLY
jgi:hypothetical protein